MRAGVMARMLPARVVLAAQVSLLVLCVGATGCMHRPAKATIPVAANAPIPLEKAPESKTPPQVSTVPLQPVPLPAITVPVKKPKKARKKIAALPPGGAGAAGPPGSQVASAGPTPETSAIGALTAGGETTPETQQKAREMIAALEKRLAGLSAAVRDAQKEGIARVRYFEREARVALKSGDAEGAVTLATKAKLLLDDLEK